jgi:hypothetical protein
MTRQEGDSLSSPNYPPNVAAIFTKDYIEMGTKRGDLRTISKKHYKGVPRLTQDNGSSIQ